MNASNLAELQSRTRIGVVGATGAVGRELLRILAERGYNPKTIRTFASARSAGSTIEEGGCTWTVEETDPSIFADLDLAFFCASSALAKELGPTAVASGTTVIDNSSAFRMDPSVPLIVPEVNPLAAYDGTPCLIANPNCSTIIALVAVTPIHRAVGVERMVVSTYQAASGGGAAMMDELRAQTEQYLRGEPLTTEVSGRQYAFNVFSHNSDIGPDGSNEEEAKLVRETHRIWDDSSVRITGTCIRVPVLRAHSEAINLTLRTPLSERDARALLHDAAGITVIDDRERNRFPEPIDASGRDDVYVGRIRHDASQDGEYGLNLFVAGDQLRKGAALNAVQIAESLVAHASVVS